MKGLCNADRGFESPRLRRESPANTSVFAGLHAFPRVLWTIFVSWLLRFGVARDDDVGVLPLLCTHFYSTIAGANLRVLAFEAEWSLLYDKTLVSSQVGATMEGEEKVIRPLHSPQR